MQEKSPQIPPPHSGTFENGISHPLLHLWDAWSYVEDEIMHLYCLALSRLKPDGIEILPSERNDFPFHIRHFSSSNEGKTWQDEGCFISPESWLEKYNCYTVWSGSIEVLPDGRKLTAFTALENVNEDHKFVQNIGIATSTDGYTLNNNLNVALSSSRRDWDDIRKSGYYLGAKENLGSNDGETNGPILAWRDPYVFQDKDGNLHLFWAGKISPTKSALVRAELTAKGDSFEISKIAPPVTVPDGDEFTQLEIPKVYFDEDKELYYLAIATCNRIYEGQPDSEVGKGVRFYKSEGIDGPWVSLGDKILEDENLFGVTVLKPDYKNNRLLCIAPYTDAAKKDKLTFSKVFYVYLDVLRIEFL